MWARWGGVRRALLLRPKDASGSNKRAAAALTKGAAIEQATVLRNRSVQTSAASSKAACGRAVARMKAGRLRWLGGRPAWLRERFSADRAART